MLTLPALGQDYGNPIGKQGGKAALAVMEVWVEVALLPLTIPPEALIFPIALQQFALVTLLVATQSLEMLVHAYGNSGFSFAIPVSVWKMLYEHKVPASKCSCFCFPA